MSFIEVDYNDQSGWLCNDDLMLICDREAAVDDLASFFMSDDKLQSIHRMRRRHVPKVDFNDRKLFPSLSNRPVRVLSASCNDELLSELDSMLACREYVRKQNPLFDRKQFQEAQAAQADEEKKLEEYRKRQQEQNQMERQQRRRLHPSYISRFDEKRYVPSGRKRVSRFDR